MLLDYNTEKQIFIWKHNVYKQGQTNHHLEKKEKVLGLIKSGKLTQGVVARIIKFGHSGLESFWVDC